MHVRTQRSGAFDYLRMAQSHCVNGAPRQTVVATFGRLDALKESGELDRLLRSGARLACSLARFTESAMLLSPVENGEATTIDARRIGHALSSSDFGATVVADR
jgi:hypothetical protein